MHADLNHLPELNGPRLQLRTLDAGDADLYCALYCDARVMRHVAPPLSPMHARRAFAATWRADAECAARQGHWVIIERHGSVAIGLIGLTRVSPMTAELGILILPDRHRRGYAKEALSLLVEHVFSATPLTCLLARHAASNGAMAAVLTGLGFAPLPVDANSAFAWRWELQCADWMEGIDCNRALFRYRAEPVHPAD
jgi:RimJ/RimL family protein N-acetyltransferase